MIQICVLYLFVLEPGLSSCEFGRVALAKNINKILTPTGWLRLNLKHKMMAWGQGARKEKNKRRTRKRNELCTAEHDEKLVTEASA